MVLEPGSNRPIPGANRWDNFLSDKNPGAKCLDLTACRQHCADAPITIQHFVKYSGAVLDILSYFHPTRGITQDHESLPASMHHRGHVHADSSKKHWPVVCAVMC